MATPLKFDSHFKLQSAAADLEPLNYESHKLEQRIFFSPGLKTPCSLSRLELPNSLSSSPKPLAPLVFWILEPHLTT